MLTGMNLDGYILKSGKRKNQTSERNAFIEIEGKDNTIFYFKIHQVYKIHIKYQEYNEEKSDDKGWLSGYCMYKDESEVKSGPHMFPKLKEENTLSYIPIQWDGFRVSDVYKIDYLF